MVLKCIGGCCVLKVQTFNVFQRVLVLRQLKCYIPLLLGAEFKCTFVVGSLARSLELGPQVEVCPQVVEQTLGDSLILGWDKPCVTFTSRNIKGLALVVES